MQNRLNTIFIVSVDYWISRKTRFSKRI